MQSLLHYRDVDPDLCIVLYRGVVRIRLTSVYRSYCVKEVHRTHHVSNTHEDSGHTTGTTTYTCLYLEK